jgi:hypothetical protein
MGLNLSKLPKYHSYDCESMVMHNIMPVHDSTVQTQLHCAHHCGVVQSPGPLTWLEPSTVTVLSLLTFGLGALPEWPDPAVLTLLRVDSAVEGGVTGMGWGPCGSGR